MNLFCASNLPRIYQNTAQNRLLFANLFIRATKEMRIMLPLLRLLWLTKQYKKLAQPVAIQS